MISKSLLVLAAVFGLAVTAAPALAGDDYYDEHRTESHDYDDRYDRDDDYDRHTYYRREERRYVPAPTYRQTIVHRHVAPYVQRREVFYDGPCRVERSFLSTGRMEEHRNCPAPPRVVVRPAPVVEYHY